MNIIHTIESLCSDLANTVSRRALQADPQLRDQLAALDGRCIEIQCSMPVTVWHLLVRDGAVEFNPGAAASPNVVVSGNAWHLLGWLLNSDDAQVSIQGDDTTLLELMGLLQKYNPDFAHSLTQVLGPDLAQRLVGGAEVGINTLKSLVQGIGEGLQNQAAGRFVQRENLDELLGGIDELRLQVDRLAAKVRQREDERKPQ